MSTENNQLSMKFKNRISIKKPNNNLYSKSKTNSEKNDYYDELISSERKNSKIYIKKTNTTDKKRKSIEKKNKNKNNFISISDLTMSNEQMFDNNNYMNIIHTSINSQPNNYNKYKNNKIKSVDANNYFNRENNSIASFNDLKLNILNKKYSFNNPFTFCKNGIDITNTEKIEEEKNYQMKRYRYLKCYKYTFNSELHREKSKIIQKWWKKTIIPKLIKKRKVLKIQSVYRGYITRKHLNDIICISVIFQNFINKLNKVFTNFVRRNYFPKRYYKKKYALEKIFPLKLKVFLRKWRKYKNDCTQKEQASENMIKIREKNRYVLYVLKSYFNIWKLKCEKINQDETSIKLLNDKDTKYNAIAKLFHKIEKIGNKKAFGLSKNNLRKYLMYIFRNKYAKKIFNFYKKFNNQRLLKVFFDKWRNNINKEKERNLKMKILSNEIKNQIRINDKENLRNNFNNLRAKINLLNIRNLKRAKEKFIFPQANKHITNCIRKNIIRNIFNNYIRKISIKKKLIKIIQKRKIKYYIKKWKKIIDVKKYNENRKNKMKKLILNLSHIINNKKLSKYLFKWKSNTFINKFGKKQINSYGKLIYSILHYINNKNMPNKKNAFIKMKFHINPKSKIIKKKLLKITNNLINKTTRLNLVKVINKWKKFVQYQKLNDLKAKNLETVARLSKTIYNSKKLTQNLYNWKQKNNLMKLINKNKFDNDVRTLIDILNKIKNRKMKLFFDCVKKAKINLLMKIIIKNIYNNHIKKILKNKFNQWKLNTIKKQNKIQLANINKLSKLKYIITNLIKAKDKSNFGSLKKTLSKWYLISKLINVENYNRFLKNIKNALQKLKNTCVNFSLKKPFDKIKNSEINKKNIILLRLKKYFINNDKNNLRNAFLNFYSISKNETKKILKANILFNLKQKYYQIKTKTLLMKYFHKWKLLNHFLTKEKIISAKNMNTLLYNSFKKKAQKYSFDKLIHIKKKYYLNEFVQKLFKLYELSEKRCLYKNIKKWKNISDNIKFKDSQRQKGYQIIYNTLSKAFSWKNAGDILSSLINKHMNDNYKIFFAKFRQLYKSKLHSTYSNSINNSKIAIRYHFEFKNNNKTKTPLNNNYNIIKEKNKYNIKNERRSKYKISNRKSINKKSNIIINIENRKNNFYKERLIPHFISYLNKLRLKRLQIAFEYISILYKNKAFCKKISSWEKSESLIAKNQLIKSFKIYIFKQKILENMRKAGINNLTSYYLLITKRRNDLFILVHTTRIIKRINKLRKSWRYIRLWRLYMKLIKEKEAQLRKMERSFSQTYELLSDGIFVDKGDEKSVQTQMMSFVDKVNFGSNKRNSTKYKTMNSLSSLSPEKNDKEKLYINNNYNVFQSNEIENFAGSNLKYQSNNRKFNDSNNNIKSSIFDKK